MSFMMTGYHVDDDDNVNLDADDDLMMMWWWCLQVQLRLDSLVIPIGTHQVIKANRKWWMTIKAIMMIVSAVSVDVWWWELLYDLKYVLLHSPLSFPIYWKSAFFQTFVYNLPPSLCEILDDLVSNGLLNPLLMRWLGDSKAN